MKILPLVLVVLAGGCSSNDTAPSSRSSSPAPSHGSATVAGSPAVPAPARLNITPGDPSYVTFSTSATTETATWSVTADLKGFSLPSDGIALPISSGPLATGFANVNQGDASGFSKASGGSVVLSFSPSADRVVVEVSAEPAAMSARVEAELIVLCWVPRGALAEPGEVHNGTTGPGSDEVLVQDVGFVTAGCKPFAPRAP